jgi:hypothetical protein
MEVVRLASVNYDASVTSKFIFYTAFYRFSNAAIPNNATPVFSGYCYGGGIVEIFPCTATLY